MEEVLLEVVVVSSEHLDTSLACAERPGVPDPQGVVHGVGKNVGAVWGELHPSDSVSVALQSTVIFTPVLSGTYLHLRHQSILPSVPDLEVIVNTSGDDLGWILIELDSGDLVVVVEGGDGLSPTWVPDLDLTVIPP